MKKLLSVLLLFVALRCFGASGDVLGAWTATNGGILYVNVTNVSTNGTWSSFGFGANYKWTGTEAVKVKLHVTGDGFDTNGAVITSRERLLVGTSKFPSLYPATNSFETSGNGTVTTLQIAMSDFVFTNETVTLDIGSGLYTESAKANNAATGITVTNFSMLFYTNARPVFAWLTPQYDRSTGSSFRVEFLACHWSSIYANNGRPLQAIKLSATDQNSHAVTNIITDMYFDYNQNGIGGARYVWDVPTGTFNDTNVITVQALTLPYIGTNAVIDTSDGVYVAGTPNYCPLKFLNDPNGTFGQSYANVSTNTGLDLTGVVTNIANWSTNTAPFYTITGAANAIAKYNSNFFGRLDVGGGHINLEAGGYRMGGTNLGTGQRPRTYVELKPYPGLQPSDCYIFSNHLTTDVNQLVKLSGLMLKGEAVGTAQIFNIVDCVWTDNCEFACGQSAALNIVTNWYITGCRFYRMAQGVRMFTASAGGPVFARDSIFEFTNATTAVTPVLFRCSKTNKFGGSGLTINDSTSAVAQRPCSIWAYNVLFAVTNAGGTDVSAMDRFTTANYVGKAVMGNLVECLHDSTTRIINFGSQSSNAINFMVFNNTFVNKINWFYDDGTTVWPRFYSPSWVIGNYCDDTNIKDDTHATADAARYGNRPQGYNVGFSHNLLPETSSIGSFANFMQGVTLSGLSVFGLNSYSTNGTLGSTNILFRFTDRKSYILTPGVGGGNYKYLCDSPAFQFVGPRVLNFKLDGPTSAIDPPGAFTSGNVKKGAFF